MYRAVGDASTKVDVMISTRLDTFMEEHGNNDFVKDFMKEFILVHYKMSQEY